MIPPSPRQGRSDSRHGGRRGRDPDRCFWLGVGGEEGELRETAGRRGKGGGVPTPSSARPLWGAGTGARLGKGGRRFAAWEAGSFEGKGGAGAAGAGALPAVRCLPAWLSRTAVLSQP